MPGFLHNEPMTMLPAEIHYEFEFRPEAGEAVDIAPGIKWLRLPLPFLLGHINVWLLQDGDGWAIVDTGLFTNTTQEVWNHVFKTYLDNAPITRVLVTHLHPDHVGCAGWLTQEFDIELWMSGGEYLMCRILVADTGLPIPKVAEKFYLSAGYSDESLRRYRSSFGRFGKVVAPMPQSYRRLHDGMRLNIGKFEWRVIFGRGHSPEHACFYCEELNTLISGDQILPTISSNVSVYPTEPAANPLADWLDSLHLLKDVLPPDVLVLPAHGKPFRGPHARLDELILEHQTGLEKLRLLCHEPQRAIDVFPALFKSRITDNNLMMATGEAIAHLSYLSHQDELNITCDENGVNWYCMRER
jgi:glyoxylase-like metal-dependent hydrolase (beta-lactamase superfamily II)